MAPGQMKDPKTIAEEILAQRKESHPGEKLDPAPADEVAAVENGDLYDEDSGEYIATIPLPDELPAQLALFYRGYWYVFKPSHRYKDETPDPSTAT